MGRSAPEPPSGDMPARYAQLWAAWPGARVLRPELRPTLAPAYAGNSGGSRTPPLLVAAKSRSTGYIPSFLQSGQIPKCVHQSKTLNPGGSLPIGCVCAASA